MPHDDWRQELECALDSSVEEVEEEDKEEVQEAVDIRDIMDIPLTLPLPQYWVLSFDPGTRDLGVALVGYGAEGSDPLNELEYHIRYGAVWDVIHAERATLQQNLEALHGVLSSDPTLCAVLADPNRVDVIIENQEGCDFSNATLTASLMRMCGMASALWMYFAVRGHHVEIVGKKSKWGWASLKDAPGYKAANEARRRDLRKKYITYFVIDLMRRQHQRAVDSVTAEVRARGPGDPVYDAAINVCVVTKQMMANFEGLPMDEKAHICDCIVQGMFYARKRFRKSSKNVFVPAVWTRLVEAVTTGGRRGVLRRLPRTPARSTSVSSKSSKSSKSCNPSKKRKRLDGDGSNAPLSKRVKTIAENKTNTAKSANKTTKTSTDTVKISAYTRVPASSIPLGMSIPPR